MKEKRYAPEYSGYDSKAAGKSEKSSDATYDSHIKRMLQSMGIKEADERWKDWLLPSNAYGMKSSTPGRPGMIYNLPPSALERAMGNAGKGYGMQQMNGRGYSPLMHGTGPQEMTSISIKYTSSDGTVYKSSITTPYESPGKGMYNALCGLYGMMSADGKGSAYSGKGGGKGGYSGSSGSGSGSGGSYGGGSGGGK